MTDAEHMLAARVAVAVIACPSVASLTPGPHGTCATYGPGQRIDGVCLHSNTVEVHVVGRWGIPAVEVATEIREVLRPHFPDRVVDVVIEDITDMPADDIGDGQMADVGASQVPVSDVRVSDYRASELRVPDGVPS